MNTFRFVSAAWSENEKSPTPTVAQEITAHATTRHTNNQQFA